MINGITVGFHPQVESAYGCRFLNLLNIDEII